MKSVELTEQELELLKLSIDHCLKTCHQGSAEHGCKDCLALEAVKAKLG